MPALTHLDMDSMPRDLVQMVENAPMPSLAEGPPCAPLAEYLRSSNSIESICSPGRIAALWLLAGELDTSHEWSQTLHTPVGSYWHGVMHRREGDYGNAKYWFRRAGRLGMEKQLAEAISQEPLTSDLMKGDAWNADQFVDQCQRAVRNGQDEAACQLAQWLEWQVVWNVSS